MKTAISIPDDIFERVEEQAKELGWSRSQFFTVAAEAYLTKLEEKLMVEIINHAVETTGINEDESTKWAIEAGKNTLRRTEW